MGRGRSGGFSLTLITLFCVITTVITLLLPLWSNLLKPVPPSKCFLSPLLVFTSGYFSNGFPFWREGLHVISKTLEVTPEYAKWMPLAPGCNGSLHFVQHPVRTSPETPAAQGLAGEQSLDTLFGSGIPMGAVKACTQVHWLNWGWIQSKNESAGGFKLLPRLPCRWLRLWG